MGFCSWVDVLHQNKKSFFGPMFSISSESLKASDREGVVLSKMRLLNAGDIYVVCFKKGLKFKFFGSRSFSIPGHDLHPAHKAASSNFEGLHGCIL